MDVHSDWLTTARLARAARALSVLEQDRRRWPRKEAARAVFRRAGGAADEADSILELLIVSRLIEVKGDTVQVTTAGIQIATGVADGDVMAIGLTFIRAGFFHDQARALMESGSINEFGELECPTALARTIASQLVGLLEWWDGVEILPRVRIPVSLVQELGTIAALLPGDAFAPKWVEDQKMVGNRAETYSVKWERTRASDPRLIAHVAPDSDTLGWDVEDRSSTELRRIEVKGRRSAEMIFNLSENELKKAKEHGTRYELQFWGEIDLNTDAEIEYASLTAAGYPTCIENLAAELASGRWIMTPTNWRVSRTPLGP